MRKIIILIGAIILTSCDPESCSEETISNNTGSDLQINFISSNASFNNQVFLEKQSKKTIGQIECALGSVVVNYSIYDSVYITNSLDKVLKVFREDTSGKNIYNIDKYWDVNETSENYYVYEYEITEEDLK